MEWYKKSANNGYDNAKKRLNKLSENVLLDDKEKTGKFNLFIKLYN